MNIIHSKKIKLLLTAILLCGLLLLLYPAVSSYGNSLRSHRTIDSYTDEVAQLESESYAQMWSAAKAYNRALAEESDNFLPTAAQDEEYTRLLDISGVGIMGYVEIPLIDVRLPIYHGTDESVLQKAVGHLAWSSLPVGGQSTHCVLSAHRALPSAKLFTNLDRLTEGDSFKLHILDEVLTYEVDQISIVKPQEVDKLQIIDGKDLCTLVTCTPYGINTERLLVRGHRVDDSQAAVRLTTEALPIEPLFIVPVLALPILPPLLIAIIISLLRPMSRQILFPRKSAENIK